MTLTNVAFTKWLTDVFPDMLWLCALISIDLDDGMRAASAALNMIDEALKEAKAEGAVVMDGRLTSLEAVPEQARVAAIAKLQRAQGYELAVPEDFAHALGMYPGAPGSWLTEPWKGRGLVIDWEVAQRFLARVITDAHHGQSDVSTRAKFIALSRWAKAGKLRLPHDSVMVELFPRYPHGLDEEEKKLAESMARAAFGALVGAAAQDQAKEGVDWGQEFWRSNWRKFACSFRDPSVASSDTNEVERAHEALQGQAQAIHRRFLEVAQTADPDLYSPDRFEVLTGITAASIRAVAGASRTPLLWSAEHGVPILRSIVESLIVLRWLVKRDDPSMFRRFKDYGVGRLKLLKLHLQEYLDAQDEPSEELQAYADYLQAEVNQDTFEEYQEIDLSGTFSGLDARKMAAEVDMEIEYRFVYAPTSAAAHREWTTLDRYSLERCENPLHRWHRMPRRDLSVLIGPEIIETGLSMAEDMVDAYQEAVSRSTGKPSSA